MEQTGDQGLGTAEQTDEAENTDRIIEMEQALRPREEVNMLLMGFALGLIIGFFFLIYVVLAISHIGQ